MFCRTHTVSVDAGEVPLEEEAISLFRFSKVLFGPLAVGDVVGDDEDRPPATDVDRVRHDLHVDDSLVAQPVSPCARGLKVVDLTASTKLNQLPDARDILGRANVGDAHGKELFARVAIVRDGRRIHVEKDERLGVIDPHRARILREQQAKARLAPQAALLVARSSSGCSHDLSDADRLASGSTSGSIWDV